jgi:putative transposase
VTDQAIALLAPRIGTRAACAASGVAQASWYRRHRASPPPLQRPAVPQRDRVQPRALSPAERAAILAALHAERFADRRLELSPGGLGLRRLEVSVGISLWIGVKTR